MDLGVAKMIAGEPDGLELLKQAVDDHRRQVRLDGNPQQLPHFVHLRHLSEAALVLGSAYVRLGKPAEARTAFQESRNAAAQILAVADVQESLREEAKQFLTLLDKQEAALVQAVQ